MNTVPTIGGARGVFEIFVPGVFLFANLLGCVYGLSFTDAGTRALITGLASTPSLTILVSVPFAYLVGVILRLFRADRCDRLSMLFLRLIRSKARRATGDWARESFPYNKWLGAVAQERLPAGADEFYRSIWKDRTTKQFINFCKVVVACGDPAAAVEIYVAESLTRYISGMFYALLLATVMMLALAASTAFAEGRVHGPALLLTAFYVAGVLVILRSFHFIRIKEVETIFAASFKNRHLF
ncbi:MAG: hypothetical protein AABN34_21380 [Acidobacteriota bacterium]